MITCKVQMKNKIVNELLANLGENPTTEELLQATVDLLENVTPDFEELALTMKCAKTLRAELARSVQIAKPYQKQPSKPVDHQNSVH